MEKIELIDNQEIIVYLPSLEDIIRWADGDFVV